ncbi:hypothetical protein JOF56_003489 [Kibdelosporangium banguiense]|uniref:Uncharacterized protein n=1 Tax=Kibdelosporangium banguiense TaxID=1365924 RepID=A0ABS4TFH0_9PSEU|nr:hypothetical protein [Kibdelosporangium banguiense]MBP2323104.1 hypothetical protein [Kibdelosporangium banguiense]
MTSPNAGRFSHMPTTELEKLLRRNGLPLADFQSVQAELTRRYTADVTSTPPPPPPVAPPQWPHTPPPPAPAQAPMPTPAPPPRPVHQPSAGGSVGKAVLTVILVLVLVIGAVLYFSAGSDDGFDTWQPARSTTCMATLGPCQLPAAVAVGSSCTCSDQYQTYPGTVQ